MPGRGGAACPDLAMKTVSIVPPSLFCSFLKTKLIYLDKPFQAELKDMGKSDNDY